VAHQVLNAIWQSPTQDDWHYISQKEIHEITQRSKNAIRTALKQLELLKYIVIDSCRPPGTFQPKYRYHIVDGGIENEQY